MRAQPERNAEADRLLLQAAFLADSSAAGAWEGWCRRVAIDDVDLQSQRILPRVHLNHAANGVRDGRIRGLYRRAWYSNGVLLQSVMPVFAELRERGVRAVAERQSAAVVAARGSFPLERFHLAVPDDGLDDAINALEGLGWRAYRRSSHLTVAAALGVLELRAGPVALALRSHAAADETFWNHTRALDLGGQEVHVPGPAEQVLDAAAPEFHWHLLSMTQRLHLTLLALNDPLDGMPWSRLSRIASDRALCLPLADVLELLRRDHAVPVPDGMVRDLRARAASVTNALEYRASRGPATRWRRVLLPALEYRRAWARRLVRGPVQYLNVRWNLDSGWGVAGHVGRRLLGGRKAVP